MMMEMMRGKIFKLLDRRKKAQQKGQFRMNPIHPVIPPQDVFWVCFGGPSTFSAGVWMSRG